MKGRLLALGLLLCLTSGCYPRMGLLLRNAPRESPAAQEDTASLFTPAELAELLSQEAPSPLFASPSFQGEPSFWAGATRRPDLSWEEEWNDRFRNEILAEEPVKQEASFDIPIVVNAKVEQYIRYFQNGGKKKFSHWLARSAKYIPLMRNLLREHGLPEDLVYLALIESGFSPYAYSRSKAVGPWQFIYRTGVKYGLNVNWWLDERRDPEKSTVAAAKYLKDLYDLFECWYLAAAGYNAGEFKIAKAMKRYRTEDFWELTKHRYLKPETKNYVPQIIAAALIAKDPEKYGFSNIEYQDPLCFDKVKVPQVTALSVIAKACEIPLEELKDLNPELLREFTPPGIEDYEARIPCGKEELFAKNFEALRPAHPLQFKTHVVKKGDTLSVIAKRYGVSLDPLLEINKLKKTSRLSIGMNLLIPIPRSPDKKASGNVNPAAQTGSPVPGAKKITYTVREGDTLWDIAQRYHLTISEIQAWNNLGEGDLIHPADEIKLWIRRVKSSTLN